jgi:hypothetical protein
MCSFVFCGHVGSKMVFFQTIDLRSASLQLLSLIHSSYLSLLDFYVEIG